MYYAYAQRSMVKMCLLHAAFAQKLVVSVIQLNTCRVAPLHAYITLDPLHFHSAFSLSTYTADTFQFRPSICLICFFFYFLLVTMLATAHRSRISIHPSICTEIHRKTEHFWSHPFKVIQGHQKLHGPINYI